MAIFDTWCHNLKMKVNMKSFVCFSLIISISLGFITLSNLAQAEDSCSELDSYVPLFNRMTGKCELALTKCQLESLLQEGFEHIVPHQCSIFEPPGHTCAEYTQPKQMYNRVSGHCVIVEDVCTYGNYTLIGYHEDAAGECSL